MKYLLLLAALIFLTHDAHAQHDPILNKYRPIEFGICEDVNLRCVKMIPVTSEIFYAVFSDDGKLLSISKFVNGKEVAIHGKIPLRKNELQL